MTKRNELLRKIFGFDDPNNKYTAPVPNELPAPQAPALQPEPVSAPELAASPADILRQAISELETEGAFDRIIDELIASSQD